jgi:hypothetical protein
MTTTETPYVEPPVYVETVAPVHRGSALASAVALYLGGYILIAALSGQLAASLAGFGGGPEYLPLFFGQLFFAVVAVIFGLLIAPAGASRKIIAIVIVLVGVVATLAAETARLTSNIGGLPLGFTLANPYFMTLLTLGAAWLIVRYARFGWLALLLTVVLVPLPYLFSFGGFSVAISQPALLIITGIVGLIILAAGRGRRRAVVVA